MTQEVLDQASQAEAEMAATAQACIMAALDHSKAAHISVRIDVDDGKGPSPTLELPPRALRFFAAVLRQMSRREPVVLIPHRAEMTTQEAAAFLNVSRPFVIKEVDAGRIKCRLVNRHRRIAFEDLVRYQAEQKVRSEAALVELSRLSDEIGQDL